jgi:cell division septation protein DedD
MMTLKNRRVFELRLGKVGLILFISGISVLLFGIFLLGIVVGKHMETYPERYASGIPDLIREHVFASLPRPDRGVSAAIDQGNRDESAAGADAAAILSDAAVADKEKTAVGMSSGTAYGKPPETSPGQPVPGRIRTADGSAVKIAPPALSDEAGAHKRALPPDGEPRREGSEQKRPPEETAKKRQGQYEVQVAAYREKRQAEELVKKFAGLGFAHRVVMKDLPGKGRWFRVIAGGFETREMAQEAAGQMAGKVIGLKCFVRLADGDGKSSE